jgi:hypothetical protein
MKLNPHCCGEKLVTAWLFMLRGYKEDNWGNQVSFIGESVRKRGSWELPFREDLSLEAED